MGKWQLLVLLIFVVSVSGWFGYENGRRAALYDQYGEQAFEEENIGDAADEQEEPSEYPLTEASPDAAAAGDAAKASPAPSGPAADAEKKPQTADIRPSAPADREERSNRIRGMLKPDINGLRGARGHAKAADEWNASTVVSDYARVGINLRDGEAENISLAIRNFTSPDRAALMREAVTSGDAGSDWYTQYYRVLEYTRIAPSSPQGAVLYKGISTDDENAAHLMNMKAGDEFYLGSIETFTSGRENAVRTAGSDGIILEITGGVRDGVSVSGFSENYDGMEVLVSDRTFAAEEIRDNSGGVRRVIILRRK